MPDTERICIDLRSMIRTNQEHIIMKYAYTRIVEP